MYEDLLLITVHIHRFEMHVQILNEREVKERRDTVLETVIGKKKLEV